MPSCNSILYTSTWTIIITSYRKLISKFKVASLSCRDCDENWISLDACLHRLSWHVQISPFNPFPSLSTILALFWRHPSRNKGEQHQEHQHQQHQYYVSVMITSRVEKPSTKSLGMFAMLCFSMFFRRKRLPRCWFQLRFHATPWPHQCIWVLLPEGQPGQLHHTAASLEFFKETLNWCATSWWNGWWWKWYEMVSNPPKKYHLIQQRHPSSSYPLKAPWSWEPYRYMAWAGCHDSMVNRWGFSVELWSC